MIASQTFKTEAMKNPIRFSPLLFLKEGRESVYISEPAGNTDSGVIPGDSCKCIPLFKNVIPGILLICISFQSAKTCLQVVCEKVKNSTCILWQKFN